MANKFEEFKQLSGTWNDNFFQRLEIFTKGLNNNKKFSYRNQLVTAQISPILSRITDTVFNYEHLYTLLRSVFHMQSTLTQTDLHNKLATQERDVQAKEAFKCYLLMTKFNSTIPADIRDQKLIAGIFRLNRLEAPLNQFLGELGARIADKFKIKDEEIDTLKNTVADLERVVAESVKKEEAGDELGRQKDDEIDTLKNTVANLEKVVEERIKKERAGDELRGQKDDEIDTLKSTVIDLKKAVEENASKEQEFIELNRQKDESIKNLNDVVKRMEGEVTKLKQEKISIDLDKIRNEKIDELKDTIEKLKADNVIKARAAVELTRHTIDINEVKDEKIDNLENTIEQWTADDAKNEEKTDELSRQKDREIKKLNDILKEIKDELRTSEQANENLKAGNATLTQEAGKLQKTIENKERIIEKEQIKCTSLRSRLQKAINNQCDDRCKKLHQEQLDRLNTNFEKILKKRANIMVDDSIEEARVMKNLSQFKPDTQLKRLNFKDATFLKDQDNIDLNKVNKESAKRKGNTASPVATKRVRSS